MDAIPRSRDQAGHLVKLVSTPLAHKVGEASMGMGAANNELRPNADAGKVHGARVQLQDLSKQFGEAHAVRSLDIDIQAGEFLTLLGASGSGKTTTLNMIAGFTQPSGGKVIVDGRDITFLPPYERNVGVVFQSYALFPHMTVFENIAFPLKMRSLEGREIARRVALALDLVRLQGLHDRLPQAISGGQQQRVAVARALVYEPSVLLMDEPLGALDRTLREELQEELREIHSRVRPTIIYVTHDQEEALRLSDRIAVMVQGRIEQMGKPQEVYETPATAYVAGFLGKANFLSGSIVARTGDNLVVELAEGSRVSVKSSKDHPLGHRVSIAIRPERMRFVDEKDVPAGANCSFGEVVGRTYLGSQISWRVQVWGTAVTVTGDSESSMVIPAIGDRVYVGWDGANVAGIYSEAQVGQTSPPLG